MADIKISDLVELSGADIADTDVLPIVDTSTATTKKVQYQSIAVKFAPALGVNDNYVTDTEKTNIGNLSGTNTGDETTNSIKTKLGAADVDSDGYLTYGDWNIFNNKNSLHGIVGRPVGASNPLPTYITTTTFTLSCTANPMQYYYTGILVNVTSDKSTTLSGAANIYYIYFDAATGNLLNGTSFPGLSESSNIIVATVIWNGTDYGIVNDERHAYNRNKPWHAWAHNTVGARYRSGITLTHNTGTGLGATFAYTSGEIADEDIQFIVNSGTTGMIFYQTGATTVGFKKTPSTVPFNIGISNRPQYVRSDTWALVEMSSATNRYINVFVYATTDLRIPIMLMTETISATIAGTNGHTSISAARAVGFPNLSGTTINPEIKPIYRLIVRADGQMVAIDTSLDDYRTVTSLPMGSGTSSNTASTIYFNPTGNISSSNVQDAIAEVDTEKEGYLGVPATNGYVLTSQTDGTRVWVAPSEASSVAWGQISGTLSNQTDVSNAINAKVAANTAITGATKTKITYDAKGLVTAGADATTADIPISTDKNYVTDTEKIRISSPAATAQDGYLSSTYWNTFNNKVSYSAATARTDLIASAITDGDTDHAPNGDLIFDALALKAADNAVVKLTGGQTVAGIKTFSSSPIVPTPTTDSQACTKAYADGLAASVFWNNVRAATTANITISTALNNGDTLDGVTLATNDRVLVKDQTNAAENGIYVVGTTPARATDADSASEVNNKKIIVKEGTVNGNKFFFVTSTVVTLDTDPITVVEISTTISAGTNISISSGTISTVMNPNFTTSVETPLIKIPTTTSSSVGVIQQNSSVVFHTKTNNSLFIGDGSGNIANVTGTGDTAVGKNSLLALTSGINNTAVGYGSLMTVSSSGYNSALGTSSGYYITGVSNVMIGYQSLRGSNAGGSNASGNVAIGYQSLFNVDTGVSHVAIGYQAAYNQTTSNYSVCVGYLSGYELTGANAVCIGGLSGRYSSGAGNVIIGYQAGTGVTGTSNYANCVAVGISSALSATTASSFVCIGAYSGQLMVSAAGLTSVGNASARYLTGSYNTAIGSSAMTGVNGQSTSAYGTATGVNSLLSITTGNSNSAFGYYSLGSTSNTTNSAAFGAETLRYFNGGSNSGFGSQCLRGATGGATGTNNCGLGYTAGFSLSTGSYNVLIGNAAGYNLTTDSYKLYIDVSNTATPLIYGEFDNDKLIFNCAANLAQLAVQPTGTTDLAIATTKYVNDKVTAGSGSGGTTASRPSTPSTYQMYFDTTLGYPVWYNGTNWVNATGAVV